MAIRFGSEVCGDLASAEEREWLITNGLGSYGCGTVAGTRTRTYHGLLVAALNAPADPCTRTLLVAGLEERWGRGEPAPVDHRSIVSFALEGSVPTWRFGLGDALLEKRLWMQPGSHTTTVLYRLLQASRPLRLSLTVLVQARSHHGGTSHPQIDLRPVPQGVAMVPRLPAVPPFVVLSDRGRTELAGPGTWWCGGALTAEEERGLPGRDEHLRAFRITVELSAAEPTLTLVASTEPHPPLDGERSLQERRAHDAALLVQWQAARPAGADAAPAWVRQLVLAADQFVVARAGAAPAAQGRTLLAGYPWFGDWGRDTMISLSGLTLVTGRPAIAAQVLRTHARHLSAGLLRAGAVGAQLTWMDAKVNGVVITPRIGKPVEVNALWFCALRTMAAFAELCGESGAAYAALAGQARRGFQRFWNPEAGCCFDVLDGPGGGGGPDGPGDCHDAAVRPNQLLAVSLTDQLLTPPQARQLLAVCSQQLLTPRGLRSLDPRHPHYQGHYRGDPAARDGAYHQGTVWGWWLGPWALAHARVHRAPEQALRWLEAIGDHLAAAGLGSISEIFDGDPPHRPRGCIAQAWSVAEVLRAWTELTAMQIQAQADPP